MTCKMRQRNASLGIVSLTFVREYWTDLINQVNLTDQQKKAMLKYRKKLTGEKVKFEG